MSEAGYHIAILGATGAVGNRILEQLEQSTIPVKSVKLLASERSVGKQLNFKGEPISVELAEPDAFEGIDIVLASAGGSVSAELAPEAVKRGAVVVDNSSYWRMDERVPLVVPEVNPEALRQHQGIIANPNCSTIQMVVALKPIQDQFGLNQVIVSTYQAASGAGQSAIDEVIAEAQAYIDGDRAIMNDDAHILPVKGDVKHYPLAFNLLAQIDVFEDEGYTHEEYKMIEETKKIMLGDPKATAIKVTATTVRVPVIIGHGESVYFEVDDKSATRESVQAAFAGADGVVLQDDPDYQIYPQPLLAEGSRDTFVGRVRRDLENEGAFHAWIVSDNLLKGAAWNTVEIAEQLVKDDLVHVPEQASWK
ncbi:aspartate-semialdehyde dehydrogenase [uncultured Weissella sp.]|uniref:aspartate-semialdehyde dehydrogenase n=1 Tax=uncultured Weissella sp. TaxID=253243 RepID=UPI0027DE654C|nr:aspartate-semialdehyde dehydrogenase [uncultured Weissella sp.]